jgi:sec-independent protein translocase protein TatA
MFGLGMPELIVIGVIIVLIFGAKKLPEIGKGLGGTIREFRKVKRDMSLSDETREGEQDDGQEQSFLEKELSKKVVEQIPALKKGMKMKKKAEKIKKIIT